MLNRRQLIQSSAALVAASIFPTPSSALREPYVVIGESVSSIIWHLWDDPRNRAAPLGLTYVSEIGAFDGLGYPIVLMQCGWHLEDRRYFRGFYDFEWSNLRRDVPDDFWKHHSTDVYPNIHSYVREQRFGESPSVMRDRMEWNRLYGRLA